MRSERIIEAADKATGRKRRPTVLQVLPRLETGGVERGAIDVAAALAESGWRAVVASSGGAMLHELKRVRAEHVTLPLHSKNPLVIRRNAARLESLIRNLGADIVHVRSRAPAWSALVAARRTGTPLVTTFHGTYNMGPLKIKKPYNAVMTKGARVIAISHFIAEHIRAHYAIDDSRLRVVPRGIDFDLFDPAMVSQQRIIQLAGQWRLPDGAPVVMLPGRLTRWKGQQVMIEALAHLGRPDVRCLLVGSDQGRSGYRAALEDQARELGLSAQVHIVDECRDMPAAYMLTDVVVSASTDPEAFGRVIVEAQAMGRPVVASDHGGARETVLEGRTGWLTPPGDARALAEALERALSLDREQRAFVAEEGMAHARAHFSKQGMCQATLEIYAELLEEAAHKA